MAFKVQRVDTWAASLEDTPGSLAGKLIALSKAGINLDFIVARRAPDKPGTGVVFAAPVQGAAATRAAKKAEFQPTKTLHTVQIQGPSKVGQGAILIRALADAGLNLRGVSAAAIGSKFVAYIALDTTADAAKAVRVLRAL